MKRFKTHVVASFAATARALTVALIAVTLLAWNPPARAAAAVTAAEATALGTDAYVFGYPLVTMEYTRRVMTNVATAHGSRAPMGQLGAMRQYPDPSFLDVTAPNADTLYSFGFFDVTKEPFVLSLPDAQDRYYLFPMLSGWTDVFQDPGKRTTGTGPQKYAVTGPGWTGTLPKGVTEYKSPTGIVWILGRIYCTGTKEDYAAVHAMQDQISVVPLSAFGKPYTPHAHEVDPAIDMKTAVREQVNALSAQDYFALLAKLMKDNPPTEADAPAVAKLAKLGIVAGEPFDAAKLGPDAAKALAGVPKAANEKIMGWFKASIPAGDGKDENGWLFSTKTGLYGTNYLQRAMVTAIGLGCNRPQDAVYPTSELDAQGKPYSGANKYVVHFDKGQMPPAEAFWSLTMYNDKYFFVANPLDRYSISARQDLKANADGSVDLYLQNENPGPDKESNWLPAPKDRFILMMRLYWPKETPPSILDGTWTIPAAKRVG
ncbi:MAG: DUF1254 domain-containing protein [Ardenticatenales bacterium]